MKTSNPENQEKAVLNKCELEQLIFDLVDELSNYVPPEGMHDLLIQYQLQKEKSDDCVVIPVKPSMRTILRMVDIYAEPKTKAPMHEIYEYIVSTQLSTEESK